MNFETKITTNPNSFGKEPGIVELTDNNEFVIYKKSKWIRACFGLLGSMLDSGKEIMRFHLSEIEFYGNSENSNPKKEVQITLKDGRFVAFNIEGGDRRNLDARVQDPEGFAAKIEEKKAAPAVQKKPFVCKKCGEAFTGWYNTCPNCKTVNSMEKVN